MGGGGGGTAAVGVAGRCAISLGILCSLGPGGVDDCLVGVLRLHRGIVEVPGIRCGSCESPTCALGSASGARHASQAPSVALISRACPP